MHVERVADFRCPSTGAPLELVDAVREGDQILSGTLRAAEGSSFPIERGIPNFLDPATLSTIERTTMADYDRVAEEIYDAALAWQFAAFYENEDAVRESMLDLLDLTAVSRVLEVGAGTGRDSFRIARRLGAKGMLHLQDLSPGMMQVCRRRMSALPAQTAIEYSVSSALNLPFPDDAFDAVFHFGGFNLFGNPAHAAAELMRVARPGARIVLGDEAVAPWLRGTEFFDIVTMNNPLFKAETPLAALPAGARDVSVRWIIANCFYVISFRKGDGPPPLDLDLPHKGWRGGTMRTRYFGRLEGVTPEAKEMAVHAAKRAGKSVHQWLDELIRRGAGDSR